MHSVVFYLRSMPLQLGTYRVVHAHTKVLTSATTVVSYIVVYVVTWLEVNTELLGHTYYMSWVCPASTGLCVLSVTQSFLGWDTASAGLKAVVLRLNTTSTGLYAVFSRLGAAITGLLLSVCEGLCSEYGSLLGISRLLIL